jgi:hypothetical protein
MLAYLCHDASIAKTRCGSTARGYGMLP